MLFGVPFASREVLRFWLSVVLLHFSSLSRFWIPLDPFPLVVSTIWGSIGQLVPAGVIRPSFLLRADIWYLHGKIYIYIYIYIFKSHIFQQFQQLFSDWKLGCPAVGGFSGRGGVLSPRLFLPSSVTLSWDFWGHLQSVSFSRKSPYKDSKKRIKPGAPGPGSAHGKGC